MLANIEKPWKEAKAAVDEVFGKDVVTLEAEADEDEAYEAFDDLVQALSSLDAFQAATAKDGEGVFEITNLSADKAAEAFDATTSQATATLGQLGDTRFGAVVLKEREVAIGKLEYGYDDLKSENQAHTSAADVLVELNVAKTGVTGVVTGITATATPATGGINEIAPKFGVLARFSASPSLSPIFASLL